MSGPNLSEDWWRSYHRRRRIGRRVVATPLALPLLDALHWALLPIVHAYSLIHLVRRAARAERELRKRPKGGNPVEFGSGYGYRDEAEDLRVAKEMYNDLRSQERSKHLALHEHVIDRVSALIHQTGARRVLNFGACYAYVDSRLAALHSNVQFVGLDRAPAVKAFNEKHFNQSNLIFADGDVMDWIRRNDLTDTLVIHVRTMVYLPESFARQFYGAISDACGLYGAEPWGVSREIDGIYDLTEVDKPSVAFRSGLILHNYPALLRAAGFVPSPVEFLKLPRRDPDMWTASFSARRG